MVTQKDFQNGFGSWQKHWDHCVCYLENYFDGESDNYDFGSQIFFITYILGTLGSTSCMNTYIHNNPSLELRYHYITVTFLVTGKKFLHI